LNGAQIYAFFFQNGKGLFHFLAVTFTGEMDSGCALSAKKSKDLAIKILGRLGLKTAVQKKPPSKIEGWPRT